MESTPSQIHRPSRDGVKKKNQLIHSIIILLKNLNNSFFFRLSEIGAEIGHRITDLLVVREKSSKREIKLLNILLFIKTILWKSLFGREADKLEHSNDDDRTYYIIEKECLVNKYVSVPKDKGSLNCASFVAGMIEAVLCDCGFVSIFL